MAAIVAGIRHLDRPALVRVAVALAAIAVAYHYSLTTLARNLGVDTPLAYLGLAPVMAVVLAFQRGKPGPGELDVHDRQFDWIVGIPLIVVALSILTILPDNLSTLFWVWRIDLLSLPLFAAGVVAICFGARALWRLRAAVVLLLLAWPVPYTISLGKVLDGATWSTLVALRSIVRFIPVAATIPGQPSFFSIEHRGETFPVNVASACAGVNGIIGFLLLGVTFGLAVRGSRLRKTIWLALGMFVLWALNVARILSIFEAGRRWGETTAIDVFHPYVGLVTFNIGALAMVLAMPLFGLRFGRAGKAKPARGDADVALKHAVPRFLPAAIVVTLATAVLAFANASLRDYELVADELGEPRLASFVAQPHAPDGWSVQETNRYPWGRQYFGRDSTWVRFRFTPDRGPAAQKSSSLPLGRRAPSKPTAKSATTPIRKPSSAKAPSTALPIYADVITTSNLRSFSTFGITQCYRFHGYRLDEEKEVDLGGGITGLLVAYHNTKLGTDWTSVSWIWPVKTDEGTRFERMTVMTKVATEQKSGPTQLADDGANVDRDELIAFASALVAAQPGPGAATGATQKPVPPKRSGELVPRRPAITKPASSKSVGKGSAPVSVVPTRSNPLSRSTATTTTAPAKGSRPIGGLLSPSRATPRSGR